MSWAKIDDKLHASEKVLDCSLSARGLWLMCLSWVADKESDGAVPRSVVRLHAGAQWQELAGELVACGLWEVTETGWAFHDYLAYNPSKAQLEEERQKAADRKAAWKERQSAARGTNEPAPDPMQRSLRGNNTRTPRERRSVAVPNAERTQHPDPDPDPGVTKVTPTSSPLPPDVIPQGSAYDPARPLPVEVQNFIASKGHEAPRWEQELRLEMSLTPPLGNPAAYMTKILKRFDREGLPQRGNALGALGRHSTPAERVAAVTVMQAQKLDSDLNAIGLGRSRSVN
jgi:hypothetical protein